MKYRINNIGLWLDEPQALLTKRAAEKLRISAEHLRSVRVVRSVLDARKKGNPRYIYTVEVELASADGKLASLPPDVSEAPAAPPPPKQVRPPEQRPVIIGTGPSGLFCALGLLERRLRSTLVERGKKAV